MALRQTVRLTQNYANKLVVEPAARVVTLSEVKEHLRIPSAVTDEDTYLTGLIRRAEDYLQTIYNVAFINQTWQLSLDHWPNARENWWDGVVEGPPDFIYGDARHLTFVELPVGPLSSVTSVKVFDENSNETAVVVADVFDIDTQSRKGRLALKKGATWPIATRSINAIEIIYVAGYGTEAINVPSPIRGAVCEMIAQFYTKRGDCTNEEAVRAVKHLAGFADIRI